MTSKLVLAMVSAGWDVDVITQGDFGHCYPTQDDAAWEPVKKRLISIDGISQDGCLGRLASLPLLRFLQKARPLLWALKSVRTALKLKRTKDYDAVFSRVAPQYGHLPALLLSFLSRTPWCAAWSDPMPPRKAPAPYGSGVGAETSFALDTYWRLVAARADWHVFPCERLREYVSRYLETGSRSAAIPHIAVDRISSGDDSPAVRLDRFTLCFAGTLTDRNPATFLKGVRRFLDSHPVSEQIEITFISDNHDEVRGIAAGLGIEGCVTLHSQKSYQETLALMSASAVLLVIEADCSEGVFFPSKFVDFVQLRRPILAVSPRKGTLSDILSHHGGGIAVDVASTDDIARGITKLFLAWKDGTLEASYGADTLYPLFCRETVLDSYREVLGKISK